jgi:hypothetical protein
MLLVNSPMLETKSSTVSSTIQTEVICRIDAAPVHDVPFPHISIDGIFPAGFYGEMLCQIPAREFYAPISETGRTSGDYEQRLILHLSRLDKVPPAQRAFWQETASWFVGSDLASALVKKFAPAIAANAGRDPRTLTYGVEAMLVKDLDGYQIGPHTDIRGRAVSIMFYLPPDDSYAPFGTTLYVPREPGFHSDGSRHFGFEGFEKVETMPCRPNTMFGFARGDTSFHGVEPISSPGIERDVLLYILRWKA